MLRSDTLSYDSSIRPSRSSISDLRTAGSLRLVQLVGRRLQEGLELVLVDALVVRLFRADPTFLQHRHDGVVERLHAVLLARLDGRRNLDGLALADEVAHGRRADEDLERRAAALLVDALEEILRHDELETGGESVAHLRLLLGREDFDDAVERLGGVGGVQGAEDEVTGVGRLQRETNRLEVPHFTDEDDVR